MSSHGYAFEKLVRDEADDADYRADVKAEREALYEDCAFCDKGKYAIPDPEGSSFRMLVLCAYCRGTGRIVRS